MSKIAGSKVPRKDIGHFRPESGCIVPDPVATVLILFVLSVPNLVFSGAFWFETLHLMKWAVVFVPAGVLVAVAGARIAFIKDVRNSFVLDPFGAVWLFLVLFLVLQPLWAPVTSMPTFTREWFFFASLWGF